MFVVKQFQKEPYYYGRYRDIKSILLSLKEQALKATKKADANFYEEYLSDDAIAITPIGVFEKKPLYNKWAQLIPRSKVRA